MRSNAVFMRTPTAIGSRTLGKGFGFGILSCILCCVLSQLGAAQGPIPDAPKPSVDTSSFASVSAPVSVLAPEVPPQHRFWDKQNIALLTATATINMADFAVTRANLQSGGRELNPVVRMFGRSTGGLALNFAGETASVIGLSYFLHKTGHHRLERFASTVDVGGSAVAVAYGLTHR
jgi:hypothetical protein